MFLLFYIRNTSGVSTTVGSQFIFPTPVLFGEDPVVYVLLVTMAKSVQIDWKYPYNETQYTHFKLERQKKIVINITAVNIFRFRQTETVYIVKSHHISGNGNFSVTLILMDNLHSVAAMKLIPVPGWGRRYYVVIVRWTPQIYVTARYSNTLVEIILTDRRQFTRYIAEGPKNKIRRPLQGNETLVLVDCSSDNDTYDLSGSEIMSDKLVGVITGSCRAYTGDVTLEGYSSYELRSNNTDLVAEMLPPLSSYGRSFVVVDIEHISLPPYIIIISSDHKTEVTYYKSRNNKSSHIIIEKAGIPETITLKDNYPAYLTATKSVQIALVQRSQSATLQNVEQGDSSMCIMIPTSLFYDSYILVNPSIPNMRFYAILVSKETTAAFIAIDESLIGECFWKAVTGLFTYRVCHYYLRNEPSEHNIMSQKAIQFGCYIYGMAVDTSFMYPAGFVSSIINENNCQTTKMNEGDLIDNDCDKWVDEERFNKEDDDGDGKIDEDVGNPRRENGNWGFWQTWQCDVKCGIGFTIFRKRNCDNPPPMNDGLECLGKDRESQQSPCNTNVTCPENCPVRTFGFNCTDRCQRCVPDCNKVNGSCEICADGFSDPDNHCDKPCPEWTYGPRCSGNCKLKCHFDCIDRITGTCADILTFKEIIVLVTLSPMVLALVVICIIKLKQKLDTPVIEDTPSRVSESSGIMTSVQSSTLNTWLTTTEYTSRSEF